MKQMAAVAVILIFFFVHAFSAAAHGGGQLVAGPVQSGPFTISVWVNPPQPRTGEPLHFTVGLADPEGGAPILDARILITMESSTEDLPPVTAEATTEQSVNRLFYETDMAVEQPGPYQVTISATGVEGEGSVPVELTVDPPSGVNWFLIGLVGLLLVLILGWWQARRSRANSE
jgi:hypothetical protein